MLFRSAETQAAMFVAKQFPRDLGSVLRNLQRTCSRQTIAEIASYSYKRGDEEIVGPSVYLLKAIAQEWGNLSFGVRELSRVPGSPGVPGFSTIEAFAWDMERNVREVRNFEVKHWRDTRSGGYQMRDERDIYEIGANMGARRLRARLLAIMSISPTLIWPRPKQAKRTLPTPWPAWSPKIKWDRPRPTH